MLTWLKKFALRTAINELDQLEPIFANLIRKAQANANKIDPDMFSKELVDQVQAKACELAGLDPKEVLR